MGNLNFKRESGVPRFTADDVENADKSFPAYHSAGQINQILRCPRQRYFRYVCGLKTPPNGNLAVGKSVHEGIEHSLISKQESGSLLSRSDQTNVAHESLYSQLHDEPIDLDEGETEDSLGLMTDNLTGVWHKDIGPKRKPLDVKNCVKIDAKWKHPKSDSFRSSETTSTMPVSFTGIEPGFWIELPSLKKPILGYIDLIERASGGVYIIDAKTAGKKYSEQRDDDGRITSIQQSMQLTTYAIALKSMKIHLPLKGVGFDIMLKPSKRMPARPQILMDKSPSTIRMKHTLEVYKYVEAIDSVGVYPPCYGYHCSWCGYKSLCDKISSTSFHV